MPSALFLVLPLVAVVLVLALVLYAGKLHHQYTGVLQRKYVTESEQYCLVIFEDSGACHRILIPGAEAHKTWDSLAEGETCAVRTTGFTNLTFDLAESLVWIEGISK